MEREIEAQKKQREVEKKFRKNLSDAKDFVRCLSIHIAG